MRFSSKKKGWVVGSVSKRERVVDSILVYTDDGGETWRRQRAPSRVELIHIDFVSDKRGWIVGDGGHDSFHARRRCELDKAERRTSTARSITWIFATTKTAGSSANAERCCAPLTAAKRGR